jgi:CheY-like chemotaxis protein
MQFGKLAGIGGSYIQLARRGLSFMGDALSDLEADPSDRTALVSLERIASGFRQTGEEYGYPEITGFFGEITALLRDGNGLKSKLSAQELTRIGQVVSELDRLLSAQAQSVPESIFFLNDENGRDEGYILIVDPEPQGRESARAILESCGYRVDAAESGESAMAKELKSIPDLLLVDFSFSGTPREMSERLDFVIKIRNLSAFSLNRIIAVSSSATGAEGAGFAFDYGIDDIIAKPYREEELILRVRNQIKQKRRMERLLTEKEKALRAAAELEKKLDSFQWQLDSLRKERDSFQIRNNQLEKRNRTLVKKKTLSKLIGWFSIIILVSALFGALIVGMSDFLNSFYGYKDHSYQPKDIHRNMDNFKKHQGDATTKQY